MAGDYSATADYGGDANYDASSGQDTTAHIGIAAQTILFTSTAPNAVFAGPAYSATAQSTSGLPVTITSSTTGVCSLSSGQVSFDGVGTCTLNANQEGDAYWSEAVQVTQTFQVNRATPSSPFIDNIPTNATEFGTYVASVFTSGDGATSVTSISTAVCTVGADGRTVTFVGFGVCTLAADLAQGTHYLSAAGSNQSFPVNPAARGYWLVGSDGGIFSFGAAAFYGSMGGTPLQRPVVGITPSASRTGYWLVASDGGIFSFGNSSYYGSIPGVGLHPAGSGLPNSLNAPIVGMVPSVSGHGYFMVASDGGVFAFGDAHFAGSCPGIGGCVGSAVSVMPDSTGKGYWLVTNLGAVYAFGDAQFYGAPAAQSVPVVDAVPSPDWRGYWLLYSNGMVAGFGDATTSGAPLGYVNGFNPASAIFPTADGKGYWVASAAVTCSPTATRRIWAARRPPASTARSSPPSAFRRLRPQRLGFGDGQLRHHGLHDGAHRRAPSPPMLDAAAPRCSRPGSPRRTSGSVRPAGQAPWPGRGRRPPGSPGGSRGGTSEPAGAMCRSSGARRKCPVQATGPPRTAPPGPARPTR